MTTALLDQYRAETAAAVIDALGGSDNGPRQATSEKASEIVWGLLYAQLRGRFPNPLPPDLQAVALSASIRYAINLDKSSAVALVGGSPEAGTFTPGPWAGWTMPELVVIFRYRQRTA